MQTEFGIHHRLESCDVVCSCSHFKAIYISGDDGKSAPPFFCRFQILHTACYPVKYVDTVCDSGGSHSLQSRLFSAIQ